MRFSGEMNTSLGNGFSNLMFMLFICELNNIEPDGVVEGDDGLFGVRGGIPKSDDFTKLGLTVKMEIVKEPSLASFCGMIFDKHVKQIIVDPIKFVLNLGWTRGKYIDARRLLPQLLKGKVVCSLYQYPDCPIISHLCWNYYNQLHAYECMFDDEIQYKMPLEPMLKYKPRKPSTKLETRLLFEEMFGISVEHQLQIEKDFCKLKVSELCHSQTLDMYINELYFDYYHRYVFRHIPGFNHFRPQLPQENEAKQQQQKQQQTKQSEQGECTPACGPCPTKATCPTPNT
jgi:hypothetical protein